MEQFSNLRGERGLFKVYGPHPVKDSNPKPVLVRATTPLHDFEASKSISDAFYNFQYSVYIADSGPELISGPLKIGMDLRPQDGHLVHEMVINLSLTETLHWLRGNAEYIELTQDDKTYKTEKLSVGPSVHKDRRGRYVKVRFDGLSVPYYFDDKFLPNPTWDSLKRELGSLNKAARVLGILKQHSSLILGRAKKRPFNLSGIDEYAKHSMIYFEDVGDEIYRFVSQSEKIESAVLANPSYKPILVFSYGWSHRNPTGLRDYVLIGDDEVKKVKNYYIIDWSKVKGAVEANPYGGQGYVNWQKLPALQEKVRKRPFDLSMYKTEPERYSTRDGLHIFKGSELTEVDKEDEYLRVKVQRACKAKL